MTNTVALAMQQAVFAVKETTKGTAVFPSAAAELIAAAGTFEINQQPSFSDSDEINETLDVLERFQDQMGAGSWSCPMYIRPSGAAGTQPMGKVLFESLMGTETVSPATSVTYAQATTKPSFTLWGKKGHTVFMASGACAETCRLSFTNQGGAKADFSGGFMQMGWAGIGEVNGAVSGSTSVELAAGHTKFFTAGMYVQFDSDTNTNAGYKISSINHTTHTLTMADSITCSDEAVIKGFLPTGLTAVGAPLENKMATIEFDSVAKNLKSLSVDINSPVAWQTDEITTSGYVTEYIEDKRNISLSVDVLFREQDLSYFYDATQNTKVDVDIVISNGAGKTCTINLPYTELEVPSVSTSNPTVSLSISGKALGSSGEDSCSIVFT